MIYQECGMYMGVLVYKNMRCELEHNYVLLTEVKDELNKLHQKMISLEKYARESEQLLKSN